MVEEGEELLLLSLEEQVDALAVEGKGRLARLLGQLGAILQGAELVEGGLEGGVEELKGLRADAEKGQG